MLYNPIGYIIRTIIRRIIYLLINKKTLKILIILALIIGWLFISTKLGSYAYAYDYTYSDPNSSIYEKYEGIVNKGILLIENSQASNKSEMISLLRDSRYVHYFYFGTNISGVGNTDNFNQLNVGFVLASDLDFTLSTDYTSYMGIPCNIGSANNPYRIYSINNTSCWYATGYNFYVPESLVYYTSDSLVTWLNDTSTSQNNSIVNALDTQTTAINQQTDTIQATQNYISDDSLDTAEMSIDTSNMSVDDKGIDNYFSNFLGNLQTTIEDFNENEVISVSIPMPYNITPIVLRSDLLSSHIPNGTLKNVIQVFWTFTFGGYIVAYVYRMIKWLSSGKVFSEGGISDFIWYLDTNNEIIKGYMM